MIKKILIISIALFFVIEASAQEKKRRNRVTYSFGAGQCEGTTMSGVGQMYGFGYERALWKERLRFTYQFGYGIYNSKAMFGVGKMWFNSYNITPGFDLTLFTIKNVSLCLGGGGVINKSSGLVGSDDDPGTDGDSYYFDEKHFGYNYNVAIRYGDPAGRLFYKLEWITNQGTKQYTELGGRFIFGIRL